VSFSSWARCFWSTACVAQLSTAQCTSLTNDGSI
jgi:hypothetical protein